MERLSLLFACCLFVFSLSAQNKYTWSWESGEIPSYQSGVYGTKGVAGVYNYPGQRDNEVSWKNAAGDLWLFGGRRVLSGSSVPSLNLNDLWRFDTTTNQWTWMSGDNLPDQPGIYGTKGVPGPANKPGARQSSITWRDASGSLWLYGGVYTDNFNYRNTRAFSDLWKFDPVTNQWTWVNGSTSAERSNYGTRLVARASNTPGARINSVTWVDVSGNLWLFGGLIYPTSFTGIKNDLWKYNTATNEWTWMHGDTTEVNFGDNLTQLSVFGSKGIASATNKPGARDGAVGCTDKAGNFWLFGGQRENYPTYVYYNDLWKYDVSTNQWAWMSGDSAVNVKSTYGIKGIATPGNVPGSRRRAQTWTDTLDRLWLFGGAANVFGGNPQTMNDVWMYDKSANLWTWVRGDSSFNSAGNYGIKGTASPVVEPAARYLSSGWQDGVGNFWIFGGGGNPVNESLRNFNDLWKFNASSGLWTWTGGNQRLFALSVPGVKGTPGPANTPGSRKEAVSWTDAKGDLWLFGGEYVVGFYESAFNDLWKFDLVLKQWTLVNGDTLQNKQPVYGTRNVPDGNNNPGGRVSAVSWADKSGNLWLFGGRREDQSKGTVYLNDLWMFDTKTTFWTWVAGDSTVSSYDFQKNGLYGSKGIANASNNPKPRFDALGLTDNDGNFWLFGGGSHGPLNDLWKFDPNTKLWAWMSGDSTYPSFQNPLNPVYGTKGIASTANKPGPKSGAAGWSDLAGNLWVYSGNGAPNDLWKYNIATGSWTWVQGDLFANSKRSYGKKGVADSSNHPGSRNEAVTWTDKDGNGWLFGGPPNTNDLWKFDPVSTMWTWISGDTTYAREAVYGMKGIPNTMNDPGERISAVGWTDTSGTKWIFGGSASVENYFGVIMNDLWKLSDSDLLLPLQFTSFLATKNNNKVVLSWNTAEEFNNAYFVIQRSQNGISYDSIGSILASANGFARNNTYRFLDANPLPESNYYRIKQIDKDGQYTYSAVRKIYYEAPHFNYSIVTNPVKNQVTVAFQSNKAKQLQVSVADASGQLIFNEQIAIRPGNTVHSIPCAHLKNGMYFLTVKAQEINMTKTFLK